MPKLANSPLTPDSPISLGDKIDAYWDLKEELRAANAVVSDLKSLKTELERDLIHLLDDQGTTGGQGHKSRATINEQETAQMGNFDLVADFITEDPVERLYLLNRAINNTHWKELRAMLGIDEIPGITSYTKRSISINKVS